MSRRYRSGYLTASPPTLGTPNAGIWTMDQQFSARGQGLWPAPPAAPTIGTATAGTSLCAAVTFTAPACKGYPATITSYTVTSSPGGITKTGAASPLTVTGLTNGTSYTFTVSATNSSGLVGPASAASNSITASLAGQTAYTSPGTYSWVAPSGVTSVSAVVVGGGCGGGGALAYGNNISVTPGNSYSLKVGCAGEQSYFVNAATLYANGGGSCSGGGGGGSARNGGGNGGNRNQGGGGAGGYSGSGGTGGSCGVYTGGGGAGGAGGGGGANYLTFSQGAGGGGGVGILGESTSGKGGSRGSGGFGGSGGCNGTDGYNCCGVPMPGSGGNFGGGAANNSGFWGAKGTGAVRIIWPGSSRSFPSTNTGNL